MKWPPDGYYINPALPDMAVPRLTQEEVISMRPLDGKYPRSCQDWSESQWVEFEEDLRRLGVRRPIMRPARERCFHRLFTKKARKRSRQRAG